MPTLSAVRAFGATLPKSLTATLLGACRKLMERRPRRTAVSPDRLDDRLLRDIGVSRSDLMAAERLKKPHRRRDGR
ncbi:DUF1127 domain-containing protein (plasmid) [Azospirillum brasilense]|uniref:DUF1127 domain-containing protein n=1 Tax=Azospirillum brasilense TaxID=192 RepID=A0A4D8RQ65_AZOBR|nr:DUF1127 domain-containing protein [Azospirillum brasilense]QCO18922.1 DUF1127 domain-containing protein [Azospirillum brasilense]